MIFYLQNLPYTRNVSVVQSRRDLQDGSLPYRGGRHHMRRGDTFLLLRTNRHISVATDNALLSGPLGLPHFHSPEMHFIM